MFKIYVVSYSRQTDRQIDGDANFNSYIKNLSFFISRQTDKWTDRGTDGLTKKLIQCGLDNLLVPPGTPAARGLEELFSDVLERFLCPFVLCMCSARISLVIHINNQ